VGGRVVAGWPAKGRLAGPLSSGIAGRRGFGRFVGVRPLVAFGVHAVAERRQQAYGIHSAINKMLVLNGDFPGRTTVILSRAALGV
jgi:hypothetical protein